MATLTIADLDNGKRDLQTVDEVANSRAATATTRFGQQTTTLYEAIRRINATGDEILSNLGFRVPVPYASGLNVTDSRFTVTGPEGKVYAPLSAPFTTGAWDPSQWYVLQNELNDHKVLIFDTTLQAEVAAAILPDNQVVVVEETNSVNRVESGSLRFIRTLDYSIDTTVFGRSGLRIIRGAEYDAHYGWGGITAFPSGKWVFVYRKAPDHGIQDFAELHACDSYDQGATWINDRLVAPIAQHDVRPDPPKLMANNRMGFFVNRQSQTPGHNSPWFVTTDDEGASFNIQTVPTTSGYTFQGSGGLLEFPASQGGHDTLGFVSYGFLNAGGIDAFTTVDNGDTWSQVYEVAVPSGAVTALSENFGVRLGNQDKWIFFSRAQDSGGWRTAMTVFVTTNMLNWGPWQDGGLDLGGNPPGAIYEEETGLVHAINFARGDRNTGLYEAHMLCASADGNALFAANGNFATLGVGYKVLSATPSWTTGYLAPFKYRNKWWATFTAGEPGNSGGNRGFEVLIGDFIASSSDTLKLAQFMIQRQRNVHSIFITADDNDVATRPLTLRNAAKTAVTSYGTFGMSRTGGGSAYTYSFTGTPHIVWDTNNMLYGGLTAPFLTNVPFQVNVAGASNPAMGTTVGGSASRKHLVFHNANGEVGSISTAGTATTFSTTSDETFKEFQDFLSPEDALAIIQADPVWKYKWVPEKGGTDDIGWGAQTSYAVDKRLANPGGWFDGDTPCEPGTEGAHYSPWSMDMGRRAPYLWAAVTGLLQRVVALEKALAER